MYHQSGWLTRLSTCVCKSINLMVSVPVGCHYHQDGDVWEVSLFISPTEYVGGPHDGRRAATNYVLNIKELCECFDSIETASWQAFKLDAEDDLGSHFAIFGTYESHKVWLRILANTPDDFEAGRFENYHEKRFVESW